MKEIEIFVRLVWCPVQLWRLIWNVFYTNGIVMSPFFERFIVLVFVICLIFMQLFSIVVCLSETSFESQTDSDHNQKYDIALFDIHFSLMTINQG